MWSFPHLGSDAGRTVRPQRILAGLDDFLRFSRLPPEFVSTPFLLSLFHALSQRL